MMEVATTRNTFLILVAAVLAQIVTCEIVPLSLILDPDSTVVHYVKGRKIDSLVLAVVVIIVVVLEP